MALSGAGNPLRQWVQWTGFALHVRRKLTWREQERVGPLLDLRGTEEGRQIFDAAAEVLPKAALKFGLMEINEKQCARLITPG